MTDGRGREDCVRFGGVEKTEEDDPCRRSSDEGRGRRTSSPKWGSSTGSLRPWIRHGLTSRRFTRTGSGGRGGVEGSLKGSARAVPRRYREDSGPSPSPSDRLPRRHGNRMWRHSPHAVPPLSPTIQTSPSRRFRAVRVFLFAHAFSPPGCLNLLTRESRKIKAIRYFPERFGYFYSCHSTDTS